MNPQKTNFCIATDAYKLTHYRMLPPDVAFVYSYLESRGVSDKGVPAETLFFGLQILLEQLEGEVFTLEDIKEAKEFSKHLFGNDTYFNEQGWLDLYEAYGGKLPLRIKAVPEGTLVPSHNVLVTVENTDPKFPWLVGHIETLLLSYTWYPTTVATTSFGIKRLLRKYQLKTSDNESIDALSFMLNDFGYRGVSSNESAGIGGAAHLVNFMGTDNLNGITYAQRYYDATLPVGMSVPASEHSATIAWGEENEAKAYKHFMESYPEGLISIVSDSYDIHHTVKEIFGKELKYDILERNGTLVVRPDSGYPPTVTIQVLKELYRAFGGTTNGKGYIVLDPHVRVIYGDFIKYGMIDDILHAMDENGFAIDNIVFGMGGALLQQVNRDTFKFAFKSSAVQFKGKENEEDWVAISKNPINSDKASKAGRFLLIKDADGFKTTPYNQLWEDKDVLQTVFFNGKIRNKQSFSEIKEQSNSFIK